MCKAALLRRCVGGRRTDDTSIGEIGNKLPSGTVRMPPISEPFGRVKKFEVTHPIDEFWFTRCYGTDIDFFKPTICNMMYFLKL